MQTSDIVVLAVLVGTILAWSLYEVAALRRGWPTVSEYAQRLGRAVPFVAFWVGLIGGMLAAHFWGPWCP